MYRTLGILVLLFLGVTTLKADPLTITGGTLIFDNTGSHSFTLSGPGTVINGFNSTLSQVMGGTVPVMSGQQIQGLRLPLDSQDGEINATFPITVAGINFNSGGIILLQLASNPVSFVVPGPASGFTVTAPLTMTGGVFGFNDIGMNDQVFSHTLSGQGTQVFTFIHCAACGSPGTANVFILQSWIGTFGAVAPGVTVQSVPEPGSILLLMTSVTALSWMKRRNKRKR